MPESLLRILNGCLLALLLLFFLRVLRAVWVQVNAPRSRRRPRRRAGPPITQVVGESRGSAGELRLRVIDPTDQRGVTYDLAAEVTVGRAPGCGVSLPDSTVSQLHARVFRRDGRLYIEDLGSTNGTWVNRVRVGAPAVLKRGDRVQVGSTVLEVAK